MTEKNNADIRFNPIPRIEIYKNTYILIDGSAFLGSQKIPSEIRESKYGMWASGGDERRAPLDMPPGGVNNNDASIYLPLERWRTEDTYNSKEAELEEIINNKHS